MAKTILTPQTITHGLVPTFTSVTAALGAKFINDGNVFLEIVDGGSAATVTIETSKLHETTLTVADRTIVFTASQRKMTNTFPTDLYNQVDEYVYITTTQTVTIAALKL